MVSSTTPRLEARCPPVLIFYQSKERISSARIGSSFLFILLYRFHAQSFPAPCIFTPLVSEVLISPMNQIFHQMNQKFIFTTSDSNKLLHVLNIVSHLPVLFQSLICNISCLFVFGITANRFSSTS